MSHSGSAQDAQEPMDDTEILPVPDGDLLRTIVDTFRPALLNYERIYRIMHSNPEVSGMESQTAFTVAGILQKLGLEVYKGIGGHGVAGVFRNGDGKKILMRAELNAMPILEQTALPYKSTKRMIDKHGNERPVMHAHGHDMHMAALLGAVVLLKSAAEKWSGTLLVVFQPGEAEAGGAQAMVNDGLYSKVPVPDIMLGQHLVNLAAGKVAISPGPVLVAADSANVRIIGGPIPGVNPQLSVDPIAIAMQIIPGLEKAVHDEVGSEGDATVACWGIHADIPGNDNVACAEFLLGIKTIKPEIRRRVLAYIEKRIRDECEAAGTPQPPIINFRARTPLTENDQSISGAIGQVFGVYFGARAVEMELSRASDDFATLGAPHGVPYAYWYFGGSNDAEEGTGPINQSPFFAPVIQPTLQAGIDAMALAALTFLVNKAEMRDDISSSFTSLAVIPYLPTIASTTEPEGWDAVHVLQVENPTTGRWSCPTVTKRNRRCENVVSQERSQKVAFMLDSVSVKDAGVIAKDHKKELTALAEVMFCPLHSRANDTTTKVQAVVAQWKNYIKTSIRLQAQSRDSLNLDPKTPAVKQQPITATADVQNNRQSKVLLEELEKLTTPQVQPRFQPEAVNVSLVPQGPPPSYGTTIGEAALKNTMDMLKVLQSATLQNQQLQDQNQKLRDENAELVKEKKAAATECKRAKSELAAVEEERDALRDQVDEQFREINSLRDRAVADLETIAELQETVQKTKRAYRKLQALWATTSGVARIDV
ncbi:hypothetical protein Daus18300_003492 [Diaporthe australafricana]|uniref:Peptidase M20 dimerisation domain-containing protein n=1 Tax=Diaporthe australafricana TaxID=127596 RepID=A0ABR3XFS1_9PEZI